VQREIVATHDQVPGYLNALGRTLNTLGTIYWQLDRVDDAAQVYQEARAIQDKLVALNDMVSQYRRDLALACWNQGLALRRMGERAAADDAVAVALETWGALADEFPDEQRNHVLLCSYSAQHVQYLAGTGEIDAALGLSGRCVDQADALMASAPDDGSIRRAAWRSYRGRAHALARAGDIAGARESYGRATSVLADEMTAQDAVVREALLAAWAGDVETVAREATRLSALPEITPRQMFYLAKSLALAAGATDDASRSEQLTDEAMSWLTLAQEHGYLDGAEPANSLRTETSFALVRAHRDYGTLLTDRTRSASVETDE
jgi:tetratricopeptide (TPR) repeat protein